MSRPGSRPTSVRAGTRAGGGGRPSSRPTYRGYAAAKRGYGTRPSTHHAGGRPAGGRTDRGRHAGAGAGRHRGRSAAGNRGDSRHAGRAGGAPRHGGRASSAGPAPRRGTPRSIGHYLLGKTLGEGTFGKVKLGTHILTGENVAVKILEKSRIVEAADVERVSREIHILKRIRHRNVVQLFEVIDTPRQIFLIMEFVQGGELFDYIVKHQRVREPQAAQFFHEICDGVEYLHSMNVIHRDLKPENLLMHRHKGGWKMKVIDFGLSNTCDGGVLLKTACGSPCYAAPEMIAGHTYVGSLADTWSLGVILFALVCGYLPFEDQNTNRLYQKILHADYKPPKFISPQVRDLIRRMLTTDPKKRYSIRDVRKHPWMRQVTHTPSPTKALPSGHGDLSEVVLKHVEDLGVNRAYVIDSIRRGAHNHATTTYYLVSERLAKEHRRRGVLADDSSASAAPSNPSSLADELEAAAPLAMPIADEPKSARPDFRTRPSEHATAVASAAQQASDGAQTARERNHPRDSAISGKPEIAVTAAVDAQPTVIPEPDPAGRAAVRSPREGAARRDMPAYVVTRYPATAAGSTRAEHTAAKGRKAPVAVSGWTGASGADSAPKPAPPSRPSAAARRGRPNSASVTTRHQRVAAAAAVASRPDVAGEASGRPDSAATGRRSPRSHGPAAYGVRGTRSPSPTRLSPRGAGWTAANPGIQVPRVASPLLGEGGITGTGASLHPVAARTSPKPGQIPVAPTAPTTATVPAAAGMHVAMKPTAESGSPSQSWGTRVERPGVTTGGTGGTGASTEVPVIDDGDADRVKATAGSEDGDKESTTVKIKIPTGPVVGSEGSHVPAPPEQDTTARAGATHARAPIGRPRRPGSGPAGRPRPGRVPAGARPTGGATRPKSGNARGRTQQRASTAARGHRSPSPRPVRTDHTTIPTSAALGTPVGGKSTRTATSPSMASARMISSTSSKAPDAILREVFRVLGANHVPYRQVGPFIVRCQRMNTQFDLEVAGVAGIDGLHVVRSRPVAGDVAVLREVTGQLLQSLQL